jgi:Prealbumin-like fold domain
VFAGNSYSAAETLPTGWTLVSATCDNGSGSLSGTTLSSISVAADTDTTCTFTNQAKGTIIVEKITDDGTGSFDFTSGSLTPSPFTLTTTAAGAGGKDSETFADLSPGTYDVAETIPAGWNLVSSTCDDGSDPAAIGLDPGETVTCTFHDARERGAIDILKERKHAADGSGNHPHPGVTFTITGGNLPAAGVTAVTDANGHACVTGLVVSSLVGDYTVTETLPSGYHAAGILGKVVTVSEESAGCGPEAPAPASPDADVSFLNIPLTNVTISVDSQIPGGTASHMVCNGQEADTNAVSGDGSLTLSDLEPTAPGVTVTCTVVVDP